MGVVVDIAEVEGEITITETDVKAVTTMNPEADLKAEGVPLSLVKITHQPVAVEAEMAVEKAEVETTSTLPLIWPILLILVIWVTNHRKFGKVV